MKRFFYSVLLIPFCLSLSSAQVPNGDFESWTVGFPNDWITSNAFIGGSPVTQTNEAHSGLFAVRGEPVIYLGDTVAPMLISGDFGTGFPVTTRYNSLKFFVKCNLTGGDLFFVAAVFTLNGDTLAAGGFSTGTNIDSYSEITFPVQYSGSGTPDNVIIIIAMTGPDGASPHLGSLFYFDDISLSEQVVAVDDNKNTPEEFRLEQNFPNPFNPSTSISYTIPERAEVVLKVYDILGKEAAILENSTKDAGTYNLKFDASALPSGIYMYTLKAGSYSLTKKMMLVR
jgi:hypothetical protein